MVEQGQVYEKIGNPDISFRITNIDYDHNDSPGVIVKYTGKYNDDYVCFAARSEIDFYKYILGEYVLKDNKLKMSDAEVLRITGISKAEYFDVKTNCQNIYPQDEKKQQKKLREYCLAKIKQHQKKIGLINFFS